MSVQQCMQCAQSGRCIRVKRLVSSHPSARKLRAMGIDAGGEFRVERVSPFGDPFMIAVKGYHLALRRIDFEAMDLEIPEGKEA